MEKTTRLLVAATLFAGLVLRPSPAIAGEDDAPPLPRSLAESAASAPIPVEPAQVRFVIGPPKRRLGLEGAAFGATFGGLLLGIPTVLAGGNADEFQLTLLSAGLGGLVGGAAGAIQDRSRGSADLRMGDFVRARARSVQGTFEGATDVGVVLRLQNGDERVIPYREPLEVRRSTRLTRVGAVVGGAVTLAGVLFIHAVLCEAECSDGPSPVAYAFVGGGAVVGAGLGALVKAQDWRSVTREPGELTDIAPRRQVSFKVAPASGKGVRGQVSIRWR